MTGGTQVAAPMTGIVYKLAVSPGAMVAAGEEVVILESMKMHIPVAAPVNGQVQEVRVKEGDFVEEGDVLLVLG
ncbi:MAG: biotin/lipoyl-containing protein [Limnochordales bacterium]